jgi:hypothetical protein
MSYSDLVVIPAYTVANDGTSYLVDDDTGTYPDSAGGYAPAGAGTATRPEESQVQKWYMWQESPFDVLTENIPVTQAGLPVTIGTVGPTGLALPDNVNQFILMILPIAEVYATVLAAANSSGDPWTYLITYAQTNGAVGQVAAVIATAAANCTYDALRRFNNAQLAGGECDSTEYAIKKALLQGVYSNAAVAQSLVILTPEQATGYADAQTVLDTLITVCNDPSCQCNVCC